MSFNCDFTDWQYASGVIIPKQRGLMIENITIYCAYDYNANYAYFTNISLVLEPAETYSYDSKGTPSRRRTATPRRPASSSLTPSASRATPRPAVHRHRPQENGQVVTMMRTTVSTQPQIIIVACCITLRRSAYDMEALRLCVYRRTVQ